MRPVIIAAAAVAVFALAIALLATSAVPAPAVPAADHCLLCHPKAHPGDWMTRHAADIANADVTEATCTECHETSYCDGCHAQVPGLSAGAGSPAAANAPGGQ